MLKPRIFVGSSSEGNVLAEETKKHLQRKVTCDVKVWSRDVFALGGGFLEMLFEELRRADFGILVCTPDDQTFERGVWQQSMRDNVLFELGLFKGRLGRFRAFGVLDGPDLKIPSDLIGVSEVHVNSKKNLIEAAEKAATKLAEAITKQIAIVSAELAERLDCRMLFMLLQLGDGHYRNIDYCTGVVKHFKCDPNTPEEVITGTNHPVELARYTVRLRREANLLDEHNGQFTISDWGKRIVAFCRKNQDFKKRHSSTLTHEPYEPA